MSAMSIAKTEKGSAQGVTTVRCAFCQGAGKDPFDLLSAYAICEVCGGSGQVLVALPIHRCAFCGGSGVYPASRLTCTCCMGKGVVTVAEPAGVCPECKGTGHRPGHALPCPVCGGKGLVTLASPARNTGDKPDKPRTARERGKTKTIIA